MTDEAMRLTRLENAFVTLVDLARTADGRLDHMSQNVNQHESRLARLEASFVTLVDLAQNTGERLDDVTGAINTLSRVTVALAEAQTHTNTKLAELAEAGARTDERLNVLINIVERQISKNGDEPPQE
jgi:hypothetical protein